MIAQVKKPAIENGNSNTISYHTVNSTNMINNDNSSRGLGINNNSNMNNMAQRIM